MALIKEVTTKAGLDTETGEYLVLDKILIEGQRVSAVGFKVYKDAEHRRRDKDFEGYKAQAEAEGNPLIGNVDPLATIKVKFDFGCIIELTKDANLYEAIYTKIKEHPNLTEAVDA